MPKQILFQKSKKGLVDKIAISNYYRSKFFSVFMDKFEIEGMTPDQTRFFLTQCWEVGTYNAFILEGSKKPESLVLEGEDNEGILVITPYAPFEYNIYNYPTKLTPVRLRGATFIPEKPMTIGKDCVIGWAHTSHMPIRYLVDFYVDKIAEVEKTIDTNLFTHKLPRLVICNPDDKARVDSLLSAIEKGENRLFLEAEDWQAIKNVLDSGGTYIIDKLYTYKQNLENELLTMLGIDNKGGDKKERLIVDEVNANNNIINQGSSCFMDELETFVSEVKRVLGYTLSIKVKEAPITSMYEEDTQLDSEESKEGTQDDTSND